MFLSPQRPRRPRDGVARGTGMNENGRRRRVEPTEEWERIKQKGRLGDRSHAPSQIPVVNALHFPYLCAVGRPCQEASRDGEEKRRAVRPRRRGGGARGGREAGTKPARRSRGRVRRALAEDAKRGEPRGRGLER